MLVFLHLNSPLMFSSCLNSKSIFLSISLLRRNSNAKALWLGVCLAVFVGFSNIHFTSLNAHQRMWVGEKKPCWGEEREEGERREEKGMVGVEEEFSFLFILFVMKSRSHIILCFETTSPHHHHDQWDIFLPFIQWMEIKANAAVCQELKPLSSGRMSISQLLNFCQAISYGVG